MPIFDSPAEFNVLPPQGLTGEKAMESKVRMHDFGVSLILCNIVPKGQNPNVSSVDSQGLGTNQAGLTVFDMVLRSSLGEGEISGESLTWIC